MTKFFAALKIIWELWPYIKKLAKHGEAWELRVRQNKVGKESVLIFDAREIDESEEDTSQHAGNLNDLFR